MKSQLPFVTVILSMVLLAPAHALAEGGDLTGVWEGIQVCDDTDGGVAQTFTTDDRVEITQRGDHLHLRRVTQNGALSLTYQGAVVPLQGSDRFEAMVSVCDGNYEAQEMLRLRRVRVDQDGSGTFDAESLYASSDAPGLRGVQIFGTCKWAYQRASADDPQVPRC